uniref:Uncharacterized protein n=1 Tax=Anguilla anguilla TaxID=7936 RepID=A0A0E9XPW6_ANGAN
MCVRVGVGVNSGPVSLLGMCVRVGVGDNSGPVACCVLQYRQKAVELLCTSDND